MTTQPCSQSEFYHSHLFHDNERRMRSVVVLTFVMMVAEIVGGLLLGSMALLADGFHMMTHVAALGISSLAYAYARRHIDDVSYSFGTGKVGDLAGFTSALILVAIAFGVIYGSVQRLVAPLSIAYAEASIVAALGLAVNVMSALMMRVGDDPENRHRHHHDSNYRSAYLHILADGVTSFLTLFALLCGWAFGWRWLDPVVGMISAVVILSWALSLLRVTSAVLLDRVPQSHTSKQIRDILAQRATQITDLHLWRVGPGATAAIVAVTSSQPLRAKEVREWLRPLKLAHVTVEIDQSSN